jgi:DNA-directed RNA polymerase I subunit RPA12
MNIEITTHSRPDAFPSALRQKLRKTQTKIHEGEAAQLKVRLL